MYFKLFLNRRGQRGTVVYMQIVAPTMSVAIP